MPPRSNKQKAPATPIPDPPKSPDKRESPRIAAAKSPQNKAANDGVDYTTALEPRTLVHAELNMADIEAATYTNMLDNVAELFGKGEDQKNEGEATVLKSYASWRSLYPCLEDWNRTTDGEQGQVRKRWKLKLLTQKYSGSEMKLYLEGSSSKDELVVHIEDTKRKEMRNYADRSWTKFINGAYETEDALKAAEERKKEKAKAALEKKRIDAENKRALAAKAKAAAEEKNKNKVNEEKEAFAEDLKRKQAADDACREAKRRELELEALTAAQLKADRLASEAARLATEAKEAKAAEAERLATEAKVAKAVENIRTKEAIVSDPKTVEENSTVHVKSAKMKAAEAKVAKIDAFSSQREVDAIIGIVPQTRSIGRSLVVPAEPSKWLQGLSNAGALWNEEVNFIPREDEFNEGEVVTVDGFDIGRVLNKNEKAMNIKMHDVSGTIKTITNESLLHRVKRAPLLPPGTRTFLHGKPEEAHVLKSYLRKSIADEVNVLLADINGVVSTFPLHQIDVLRTIKQFFSSSSKKSNPMEVLTRFEENSISSSSASGTPGMKYAYAAIKTGYISEKDISLTVAGSGTKFNIMHVIPLQDITQLIQYSWEGRSTILYQPNKLEEEEFEFSKHSSSDDDDEDGLRGKSKRSRKKSKQEEKVDPQLAKANAEMAAAASIAEKAQKELERAKKENRWLDLTLTEVYDKHTESNCKGKGNEVVIPQESVADFMKDVVLAIVPEIESSITFGKETDDKGNVRHYFVATNQVSSNYFSKRKSETEEHDILGDMDDKDASKKSKKK